MPWLPMYAADSDFECLRDHLGSTNAFAYIAAVGAGHWQAVRSLPQLLPGRHCLWHIASGPLPLLVQRPSAPDAQVANPFAGWSELRQGADPTVPYFGAGHPGVLWLNVRSPRLTSAETPIVGLSSFEWIGNHYKAIGNAAVAETELCWKALRRWVAKSAKKVPRGGPSKSTPPEIWAFPCAKSLFAQGAKGGNV